MTFPYNKVVMVSPARLGDTIFCTPAIKLLKKNHPHVLIDIICTSELAANTLDNNPSINRVYLLPSKQKLREFSGYYDIGINIHGSEAANRYFQWLKVKVIDQLPKDPDKHQSEQAIELLQPFLKESLTNEDRRYSLYPKLHHFEKVRDLLKLKGVSFDDDILIGCHLGCHGIAKRGLRFWKSLTHPKVWPLKNFIDLEAAVRKFNPKTRFVLTGSRSEKTLGRMFRQKSRYVIDLVGETGVLDLVALMKYLKAYVTPDTGSLHVACSTDVNLIGLFGPTSLRRTGPYPLRPNHIVIHRESVEEIDVQPVYAAVVQHLNSTSPLGSVEE